jgi:ribonuclease VapC
LILDTSAVIAVMREELGFERLETAMESSGILAIGTPTLFETAQVMVGLYDVPGRSLLARFLEERDVVTVPFAGDHWRAAADAFIRYGKGRHPAKLNYGDCMTYATAVIADEPLLFVGDDFAKTDVAVA